MTAVLSRHFQPTQLRGVNRDQRTVDIVASDFSLDSYNTRIDPAGWDLEQFKKNPVICLQHDSYCGLPIAQALPETVRVENGKLIMTVQFPPAGTTDDADESFNLIAAGVLRGVSVGFDVDESEVVEEGGADGFKQHVTIYRKQRLMEVSFVTIPSNDNGMVVRARELNADLEVIRKQTVELEATLKNKPAHSAEDIEKWRCYFENKQPTNKAATGVLKRFFETRGEKQPDDEISAWKRMAELIEPPPPAPIVEGPKETPAVAPEEVIPPPPNPPAPEAPEPARKASVQIPLSALTELPSKLARAYVEAAVEALRQGIPVKDAVGLIDGLNLTVTTSLHP